MAQPEDSSGRLQTFSAVDNLEPSVIALEKKRRMKDAGLQKGPVETGRDFMPKEWMNIPAGIGINAIKGDD
ncbi:hypothetical protein HNQ81_002621 [Desulfoprunum benzoelyticum]|uniref:Uncharacterized protein n=1 Tax=Desulfoprunum benzoelyticum TaxID=1506996 RepID=A0A840V4R1_9BACT|nr:hypothetical protein [Desulfoprunum benzoelyticum]MBB5348880.1 hypothetical protein [Desulfoprunum benzoelyticum]